MNSRTVVTCIIVLTLIGLIGFLALSWLALGPCFIPALLGLDHFILAKGEGWSMYPTIMDDDYLIVDTTPEDLKVGDIIVYVHDGELIGHRIIKITKEGYIVKGDNNQAPDPWIVKREEIIGEVEHIIHNTLYKWIAELWFERYELTSSPP